MPAVGFRVPDGLSQCELSTLLALATASGKAVGLEVTIHNPALNGDGAAGRVLVEVLADALSG